MLVLALRVQFSADKPVLVEERAVARSRKCARRSLAILASCRCCRCRRAPLGLQKTRPAAGRRPFHKATVDVSRQLDQSASSRRELRAEQARQSHSERIVCRPAAVARFRSKSAAIARGCRQDAPSGRRARRQRGARRDRIESTSRPPTATPGTVRVERDGAAVDDRVERPLERLV